MDTKKFKIIFYIGITIAVFVNIGPALGLYNMSEDELVSWSYYWISPIAYGLTGWLTYKTSIEKKQNIHLIPIIVAGSCFVLLATFLNVIFPML